MTTACAYFGCYLSLIVNSRTDSLHSNLFHDNDNLHCDFQLTNTKIYTAKMSIHCGVYNTKWMSEVNSNTSIR